MRWELRRALRSRGTYPHLESKHGDRPVLPL
jgi:hypothetical protein